MVSTIPARKFKNLDYSSQQQYQDYNYNQGQDQNNLAFD